jgi:expansin (peptidoglycan-binding protein)
MPDRDVRIILLHALSPWMDGCRSPSASSFLNVSIGNLRTTYHTNLVTTVCRTVKKCVFVRVVDSCAGCPKGSKHVDLTKKAFAQLADLSEGEVTVAMRLATEPLEWYVNYSVKEKPFSERAN